MENDDRKPEDKPTEHGGASMFSMAAQALHQVAARGSVPNIDEDILRIVSDAALEPEPERRIAMIDLAQELRISGAKLVDIYIPEVARRVGEQWVDDRISFAEVTLICARLQQLLRALAVDWLASPQANPFCASVLVVVPEGQDHVLGALVLATQLRRCGAHVSLSLCECDADVEGNVRANGHDLVAISAAPNQDMDSLVGLVDKLRRSGRGRPKIAIGGGLLDIDRKSVSDMGADIVTNNPVRTLQLCGLKSSPQGWSWSLKSPSAMRMRAM